MSYGSVWADRFRTSKEVSKLDETTIIYYLDNYMYGQE